MSLTEETVETRGIEAFFRDEVVAAGEALRRNGKGLFPLGPDPAQASYYVERKAVPPSEQVFEIPAGELETQLRQMWREQNLTELLPLAPGIGRLAGELRQTVEQDETVSPFIYVMF